MPQLAKPRVLLDGLAIGESPRWHDGRLWLCNWGVGEIVAVGLDGSSEVVARGPEAFGLEHRVATGRPDAHHRRGAGPRGVRRLARVARRSRSHLALRLERDNGGRPRQRVRQHDQLRLRRLRRGPRHRQGTRKDRTGDARRRGPRGRQRDRVPERDGHNAGQHDADRCGVVRPTTHRLRHRCRRQPLEPPDVGRTGGPGRHLSRRRRLYLGVVGRHDQ